MIDRDRATQIILAAIINPNDTATDAAHDLAAHIATALDALGLLVVCSDPAHEQGIFDDINPAPTAEEIERIAQEAVGILDAKQLGQGTATQAHILAQQQPPNGSDPALWAGKRQRL